MLNPSLDRQPQPNGNRPVIVQFVGYKNSGKTTLLAKLVRRLKQAGLSVGTVKHDAHDFEMDRPGTDTWKHQEAGADITAISSAFRSALISQGPEPLSALIAQMSHVDVILVEGFKDADHPKLILLRSPEDAELLALRNPLLTVRWPAASMLETDIAPAANIDDEDTIADAIFSLLSASG